MKTKKIKMVEKENEKEESAIKKELLKWWDTLGLKIVYFNNAVELDKKSQDMEKEIKCWKDRFELKNKDNKSLIEKINELEETIAILNQAQKVNQEIIHKLTPKKRKITKEIENE